MTPSEPQAESLSADLTPSAPGERLREAREARGLGVEDVAARLNVPSAYISALEIGQYDKLPGLAFVRGYIRAYARFVDLPSDELVQAFNQLFGASIEPRQVTSISKVGRQAKLSDPLVRASVVIFLLAIVGASIWWWQSQTVSPFSMPADAPSATDAAAPGSPSPAVDPLDLQSRLQSRAQSENGTEPEPPTAAEESEPQYLSAEEIARLAQDLESQSGDAVQADESSEVSEPVADAQPSALAEGATLIIDFTAECWVSIRDANDKLVYASAKQAGETLEVVLETPAKVLIGRVSAVASASFGGQPLDLQAIARKDVARLTLE